MSGRQRFRPFGQFILKVGEKHLSSQDNIKSPVGLTGCADLVAFLSKLVLETLAQVAQLLLVKLSVYFFEKINVF